MRKSPTEGRAGGRTGSESLECCANREMNVKINEKVIGQWYDRHWCTGQIHGHSIRHRERKRRSQKWECYDGGAELRSWTR